MKYNWLRSPHDARDHAYKLTHITRPDNVNLASKMGRAYDQQQEGSCTANALAAAVRFLHPQLQPARNFIYYNERAMEGTVRTDAGAYGRDGVKSLAKLGVCDESLWPYDPKTMYHKPSAACYLAALPHRISEYLALHTLDDMLDCLAAGFPFVFGFTCYESFEGDEVAQTGILHMPQHGEKEVGGHEVIAIGYNIPRRVIRVRNSWGAAWGISGDFMMPFEYITSQKLADDLWTLRK